MPWDHGLVPVLPDYEETLIRDDDDDEDDNEDDDDDDDDDDNNDCKNYPLKAVC